jgi:hypothetical protein
MIPNEESKQKRQIHVMGMKDAVMLNEKGRIILIGFY